MFRFLRTGLSGFAEADIDFLENYVLARGIRGASRWKKKFLKPMRHTGRIRVEEDVLQQELAREHSVIMDGRDIGTVGLPDAEVKIYLDAGVEERARRRVGELQEKGETADFEEIKKMILERDYNDMHRAHSPLKRAADAVSLDSTGMGIDAVLHAILDIVAERVKEK